jgi:long-chain acyl-CoA synthetase
MYTSGTTAKAKGVILSHHNILEKLRMWIPYLNLTRDSRYLPQTPLFHIGGFAMMMVAVEVGMFVHIASGFQPDLAARAIHHNRITNTLLVPSMGRWLLLEPAIRQSDFSSLQVVLYGGSPMPMPSK